MRKQVVVFVHGVGDQNAGYSDECRNRIDSAVLRLIKKHSSQIDETGITYREVLWAPIASKPQSDLWRKVRKSHDLDLTKLRKFLIAFAGDAVAYQDWARGEPIYQKVHAEVQSEIDAAKKECGDGPIEFTFVAHSLGSVIVSDYLYDQADARAKATNLFTFGSPIALWTLRYGSPVNADTPVQVERPNGTWINIFDDEDVLAYPLRDLNDQYKAAVDMDYVTEIGRLKSLGNPLCHTGYWTDGNLIKPIAKKLAIDYLRVNSNIPYSKAAYLRYIKSLLNI